ncbi:MAG: nucleotidyltransferase domain-containing protein [Euzebyales bacterium]|jgi:hypothetical protein|nr:nucleotidyltransferase domain-containing protein [Euzebyales bacterium]
MTEDREARPPLDDGSATAGNAPTGPSAPSSRSPTPTRRCRSLAAVAVFGSVARGDFNVWSDVDVLIVADGLPDDYWSRLVVLGDAPCGIEPVAWTSSE